MQKKYYKNTHISRFLDKACRASSSQHNHIMYMLITNWRDIVGDKYYPLCHPIKVQNYQNSSATLLIGISNPGLTIFLQSQEQLILERVARLIGYKSIGRIRTTVAFKPPQSDSLKHAQAAEKHFVTIQQMRAMSDSLRAVDSDDLKQILQSIANDSFKVQE